MENQTYLIWWHAKQGWLADGRATKKLSMAEEFSFDEAEAICRDANNGRKKPAMTMCPAWQTED